MGECLVSLSLSLPACVLATSASVFDGERICVLSCNKKTGELKIIDENLELLDKNLKSAKTLKVSTMCDK